MLNMNEGETCKNAGCVFISMRKLVTLETKILNFDKNSAGFTRS